MRMFLKCKNEHDVSVVCIKPLTRQMYYSAISVSLLDRNVYTAYDLRLCMVL